MLSGQFQNAVATVDQQLELCKNAEKAIANVNFVFAQKPEVSANLFDLRVRALLRRDKSGEATRTAECFVGWANKQRKGRDTYRYNAACALAVCVGQSQEKDALTAKVVVLLTKLRDGGYFAVAARLKHFEQDADFAAVRDHPTFVRFVRSLKAD